MEASQDQPKECEEKLREMVMGRVSVMMRGRRELAQKENEEEEKRSDGFKSKRGAGACLACDFWVRNGLFRTGSYHNVLF